MNTYTNSLSNTRETPFSKTILLFAAALLSDPTSGSTPPTFIPASAAPTVLQTQSNENEDTHKQKLIFTLRSYRTFEKNWDGYGGKPANQGAVEDALDFLKLLPKHITLPYSGLAGDGEVDLIWDQENAFIDLSFSGDKTYSFYARNSAGIEKFGDNTPLSNTPPTELIEIIQSLK